VNLGFGFAEGSKILMAVFFAPLVMAALSDNAANFVQLSTMARSVRRRSMGMSRRMIVAVSARVRMSVRVLLLENFSRKIFFAVRVDVHLGGGNALRIVRLISSGRRCRVRRLRLREAWETLQRLPARRETCRR